MVGRAVPVGRACLLLLTPLLAGCLGGGGGADAADALDGTEAVEPDPTVAGNATPERHPFEWEDRLDAGAEGCAMLVCFGTGRNRQEHSLDGVTGGDLTLTWGTEEELSFRIEPCPRACEYETSGTSPLTLDIAWLSPEAEHVLVVDRVGSGLRVGPHTSFGVEGTVTVA